MMWKGEAIGAIVTSRGQPLPFDDKQVALIQSFAAQAVIAIENVRLFNETKEALEQQTATAEILGVISAAQTDVRPAFDAIARNAHRMRRCGVLQRAPTTAGCSTSPPPTASPRKSRKRSARSIR